MRLSELHVDDGPMICLLCFHAKWCLKHWAMEMGILAHASQPSGRRRQQWGVLGITPTKQHLLPASTRGLSPSGRRSFCGFAQVCLGPGGISSSMDCNRFLQKSNFSPGPALRRAALACCSLAGSHAPNLHLHWNFFHVWLTMVIWTWHIPEGRACIWSDQNLECGCSSSYSY